MNPPPSATITQLSADFLTRHARALHHCSGCNYCVDAVWPERAIADVCATMSQHTHAPGYSARGYIEAARALADGRALSATALAERVFTCTTCGNCDSVCPLGLRPATIVRDLRRELLDHGAAPEAVTALRATLSRDGNLHGCASAAREDWYDGLDPATAAPAVLHVGCDAAAACPDEAQAAFDVMCRAGLRPLLAPVEAGCCGAPLAELGYAEEARALATGTLAGCAAPALIALGPACARQFSAAGASGVSGLVTWLWQAVREGRVALSLTAAAPPSLAVWLIETCQLKTSAGGEEAALAALLAQLGVDVMNAHFPAPHAPCCGAAGGMAQIEAQAARRMAVARLAAIPPGVIAVTLDPRCLAHLRAAAPAVSVLGAAGFLARYCAITPLDQAAR